VLVETGKSPAALRAPAGGDHSAQLAVSAASSSIRIWTPWNGDCARATPACVGRQGITQFLERAQMGERVAFGPCGALILGEIRQDLVAQDAGLGAIEAGEFRRVAADDPAIAVADRISPCRWR
jgi:hypothetical protein